MKLLNEETLDALEIKQTDTQQVRYRVIVRGKPSALAGFRKFLEHPDYSQFSDFKTANLILNAVYTNTPDTIGFQWTSRAIFDFLTEIMALWPEFTTGTSVMKT
ncbi:MAG: hypothetical protein RIC89_09835 [Pseudomonadales bacterium]